VNCSPLESRNASDAMNCGGLTNFVKKPPPAMKLRGAWSLNSMASPGCRNLNGISGEGREAFVLDC
jgi:hypothetical protein